MAATSSATWAGGGVRRETWLENRAGSVSTSRASSSVVTMYQPGSAMAWTGACWRSRARVANGNCWKSSTKGSSLGSSTDGDMKPLLLAGADHAEELTERRDMRGGTAHLDVGHTVVTGAGAHGPDAQGRP